MTPAAPHLSVIIPTHNRPDALRRTISSLAGQVFPGWTPPVRFEVIVVDNGTGGTSLSLDSLWQNPGDLLPDPSSQNFPFDYHLLHHDAAGPTHARNLGAQHSQADILVFLDDDISVCPTGLFALLGHCQCAEQTIYLGALTLPTQLLQTSSYARAFNDPVPVNDHEIHFSFCKTGLLAMRKTTFFDLGMFNDPTGGWPNWDDVDFGYRAHLNGFRFWLCREAIGEHWDYAAQDLDQAAKRLQRAGASAVRLFQVYPELQLEFPMFRDMLPYNPDLDSFGLRLRKTARRYFSTRPALGILEKIVHWLEAFKVSSVQIRPWYTWVTGGYIYRGVQEGLQHYGPIPSLSKHGLENL